MQMIDWSKKTAFIIGNGSTRRSFPLDILRGHGTIYGCNALYRDFEPDFLVAIDDGMIDEICQSDFPASKFIVPSDADQYEPAELYGLPHGSATPRSNAGMNAMIEAIAAGHKQLIMIGFDFLIAMEELGTGNVYDASSNYGPETRATFADQARRMNYLNWFVDQHRDVRFVFTYPKIDVNIVAWEFLCEQDVYGILVDELIEDIMNDQRV